MAAPFDMKARGEMWSEMVNITHPEFGFEMNSTADQGPKWTALEQKMRDPAFKQWMQPLMIPPGRITLGDVFPNFQELGRAGGLYGAGSAAQNSGAALSAIKTNDPGRDPVTGKRRGAINADLANLRLKGFTLVGPGSKVGYGKPLMVDAGKSTERPVVGVGLDCPTQVWVDDVTAVGYFAGTRWVNDHQRFHDVDLRGNSCAILYDSNPASGGTGGLGDQHITGQSYLTDQSIASILVHPYGSVSGLRMRGGHSGMSPYWILGFDPAWPVFGDDTGELDFAKIRALVSGGYFDSHSVEQVNGGVRDMLGVRGLTDFEMDPTNQSGWFTPTRLWPELPVRAGIDVGHVHRARFAYQPPLQSASARALPAILAQYIEDVEAPAGNVRGAIELGNAQPVRLAPPDPRLHLAKKGRIQGVTFGSDGAGLDQIRVFHGFGPCDKFALVQRDGPGVEAYDCTRKVCGVSLDAYPDGDEAWHVQSKGDGEVLVHNDTGADLPMGTLLAPHPTEPGCAGRATDPERAFGELVTVAKPGRTTPVADLYGF